MTIIGYKRWMIILLLSLGGLLGFSGLVAMKQAAQQVQELGSWHAIVGYGRCRDQALQSDPKDAAQMLYIIATLPPRSTNSPSPLVWMVERERGRDIRDVIEYLRNKTGDDLGNDPIKWIQKYYPEGLSY